MAALVTIKCHYEGVDMKTFKCWINNIIYKNSVRTSQETHYVTATEPNRLMLFRGTVAVYCENHMEHMNTLCGQNAEFNIVTYSWLAWLIIMGSGFYDWVYWHFCTITVNCNSSHIELLLNNVSLTNLGLIWISDWIEFRVRVRVRMTLRLAVYHQSVRLGTEPHETHGQKYFPQVNTCGHSPYITSSLTRRLVCHLQLLMTLASAFVLGSQSRGTRDHILLSQIRDFPFVASYESQGYGGGILPRLHIGMNELS
jgi:hypothetical protein